MAISSCADTYVVAQCVYPQRTPLGEADDQCHPSDDIHRQQICAETCSRRRACGHACALTCREACGPCLVSKGKARLPCGHVMEVTWYVPLAYRLRLLLPLRQTSGVIADLGSHDLRNPSEIRCEVEVPSAGSRCEHSSPLIPHSGQNIRLMRKASTKEWYPA